MDDYKKDYDSFEQVAEIIGEEAAEKLFSRFEGQYIYFSKKIFIIKKHQRLFEDFFKNNLSYLALTEKYKYSISHIRRLISRERKRRRKESKSRQQLLFNL